MYTINGCCFQQQGAHRNDRHRHTCKFAYRVYLKYGIPYFDVYICFLGFTNFLDLLFTFNKRFIFFIV